MFRPFPLLSLSAAALISPLAHADIISTASFFGTQSVADVTAPIASSSAALSANGSIARFDANYGVLMSMNLGLSSTRTQTISGNGTTAGIGGSTTTGNGSTTRFDFNTTGVSDSFLGISTSGNCSATRGNNCTYGPIMDGGTSANRTWTISDLDSYVGTGSILATGGTTLTADAIRGTFNSASTNYRVDWNGTLTTTYSFLQHARASFANGSESLSLSLDFGTVFLGNGATLNFDIFNLLGGVGLDLDSLAPSGGDAGKFAISGCTFSALIAGGAHQCNAGFDTSALGSFGGTYTFNLSDENVGASSSRRNQVLTLDLRGTVAAAPSAVPEPASLALLGAGLAGLGLARRKRAQAS